MFFGFQLFLGFLTLWKRKFLLFLYSNIILTDTYDWTVQNQTSIMVSCRKMFLVTVRSIQLTCALLVIAFGAWSKLFHFEVSSFINHLILIKRTTLSPVSESISMSCLPRSRQNIPLSRIWSRIFSTRFCKLLNEFGLPLQRYILFLSLERIVDTNNSKGSMGDLCHHLRGPL